MTLNKLTMILAMLLIQTNLWADELPAEDGADPLKPARAPVISTASAGRLISVTIYREPDLSGNFPVNESGIATLPLIGDLAVGGMSEEDIKGRLTMLYKKYLVNPQITVGLDALDRQPGGAAGVQPFSVQTISILGEIRQSGSFDADPKGVVLTKMIAEAGGLQPTADAKRIKVIRKKNGEPEVTFYNLDLINNGEAEDPLLRGGDKIVVSQLEKDKNTVAILGEVKAAGLFEITEGTTLMRIIAKAGGFTPMAATGKVRIVRQVGGAKKVLVYDAARIISGQMDDPPVEAGDMIFVPETFF